MQYPPKNEDSRATGWLAALARDGRPSINPGAYFETILATDIEVDGEYFVRDQLSLWISFSILFAHDTVPLL